MYNNAVPFCMQFGTPIPMTQAAWNIMKQLSGLAQGTQDPGALPCGASTFQLLSSGRLTSLLDGVDKWHVMQALPTIPM